MNTTRRLLAATLLALWIAISGISGDGAGGENSGGVNIWILPRSSCVASTMPNVGVNAIPRVAPMTIPDLAHDVKLCVSNECTTVAATLFDKVTCTPMALPVVGQYVVFSPALLHNLIVSGTLVSDIVICDASNCGYILQLRIDPVNSRAQIFVY